MVSEIRQAFLLGKRKIIFFNSTETIIDILIYKVQCVIDLLPEIDISNFIFTTAAPYGQEAYDSMFKKFNWSRRLTILPGDNFELVTKNFLHGNNTLHKYLLSEDYQIKIKDKKFVCFNKIHRIHRAKLLSEMLDADLIKDSYYSFEGGWSTWLSDYTLLVAKAARYGNINIDTKFVQTLVNNEHMFPLRLNINDTRTNPIDLAYDDLKYHTESYFSIITETVFYANKEIVMTLSGHVDTLFISEKTYKAIAFKHPFIVFGCVGTIEYLKKTGYKSFHPYIDESYDSITDDHERFNVLVSEIKRLCAMTDEQWLEWQHGVKDIVEHNFKVFNEKTVFHQTKDIDKLFK
jgi:hypothetical protein